MYWLYNLFFGDTLAHTIFVLALVITVGILLGKIKIGGVSLGTTWILFVGIAASHFGMTIDPGVLSFIKEFGLILFVFSIGLQVGPGFFSSFKNGGMQLVGLASLIIAVVTFFICMAGLRIGKKFGTKLSGKASILGGIILIGIGLEIFISGVF